jgi:EAL domain-containing protein (putative c-di-GMP-specific phosphodiesterase class I)
MAKTSRKNAPSGRLPSILNASGPVADSMGRVLRAVRSHLGMDVCFVSEFAAGRRIFRHVDTSAGEGPVQVGASSPLDDGYCQRVVDGRLPELIPDTSANPVAMALPVTRAVPVGAHLSVPIRLRDGRIYGMFCCFSFAPNHSLGERDLHVMRAFADLAAYQIDCELDSVRDREEKIVRVRSAIEQEQISTVFQPIYKLDEGRVAGLESLARFSAFPSRPPDVWFAEAAEVGLGLDLELAAIRMALAGLPSFPAEVYVALNVSPELLLSGEIGTVLRRIPVERIVLEVTEHASIADYPALLGKLEPLRRRGLRLAVDDAGAGYASLRHILSLRPDLIKLDTSLTRDIDTDPARRALASALIAFAGATGSQIVAEGVETASELETLRALGAQKAQGYFLGRPMPLAGAAQLLARGAA